MVMLAEHHDFIIGGDPDRDTIDLASSTPLPAECTPSTATRQTVRPTVGCWLGPCAAQRAAASGRWRKPAASPLAWSPS